MAAKPALSRTLPTGTLLASRVLAGVAGPPRRLPFKPGDSARHRAFSFSAATPRIARLRPAASPSCSTTAWCVRACVGVLRARPAAGTHRRAAELAPSRRMGHLLGQAPVLIGADQPYLCIDCPPIRNRDAPEPARFRRRPRDSLATWCDL